MFIRLYYCLTAAPLGFTPSAMANSLSPIAYTTFWLLQYRFVCTNSAFYYVGAIYSIKHPECALWERIWLCIWDVSGGELYSVSLGSLWLMFIMWHVQEMRRAKEQMLVSVCIVSCGLGTDRAQRHCVKPQWHQPTWTTICGTDRQGHVEHSKTVPFSHIMYFEKTQ